jgi:uncharacterized protein (DUF362 family)
VLEEQKMKNSRNLRAVSDYLDNRRNFLKGTLLFSTGILLNQQPSVNAASEPAVAAPKPERSKVSFVTGTNRREMINQVMTPLKDVIQKGIQDKQVIIKPNFVSTRMPLCAPHVDAVRGVLDVLKPIYPGKIIIAESSADGNTMPGFQNYGYAPLEKEYDVTFVDLNTHTSQAVWILDRNLRPVAIQVIADYLNPKNYFISLTRLKTHNLVVATMGLKNMVMGCPLNSGSIRSKPLMHGASSRWLHYNIYLVAQLVRPQLTVIDCLEGMEGNGPINGTPVQHGVALAGTDVMAVDSIGAQLMDIPLENIGYLNYCANAGLGIIDRERIDIIGDKKPQDYVKKYQLANNIQQQLEWKEPLQLQGQQGGMGMGSRRGG